MEQFLAGQLACLRELTLFLAPNVNSYKRYAKGSFAPTAVAWGHDNRTCALRVVGHGHALRLENRVPGGDVNPYLALAAIVASGLHGVDKGLELEEEYTGNAYLADKPSVPRTLREAHDLFADSDVARQAFGGEVVDHYTNMARVELDAFDATVTDWERYRGFERLCRDSPVRNRTACRLGRCSRSATPPPRTSSSGCRPPRKRTPTRRWSGRRPRSRAGGRSPRPTGRGCCGGWPSGWMPNASAWPGWRCATPASRSQTPAASWAWWWTPSPTTPARPSGCWATPSRSPAGSTSPSGSRWAWSG
jgi:hypothetical protein